MAKLPLTKATLHCIAAHHQGAQDCGRRQEDPSSQASAGAAQDHSTATKGRNGRQAGHSAGAQDHHGVTCGTSGSDYPRPARGGNSARGRVRAPPGYAWTLRTVIPRTRCVPIRLFCRLFSSWRAAHVSAGSIYGSGADGTPAHARYARHAGVVHEFSHTVQQLARALGSVSCQGIEIISCLLNIHA